MTDILHQLFGFDGKVIILAGGAGQIGFSAAQALAGAGATVVIADQDLEMAQDKLRKLTDPALASRLKAYAVNVADEQDVSELWKRVRAEVGPVHGLVNCFHFKGNPRKLDTTSNFFSNFENYPVEAWDRVHDVNLKGSFLMCRAAVPYFREAGGGAIVNVSSTYGNVSPNPSIYGKSGINSPVAYSSSKAALINFTRYLAVHLAGDKIRANVLSPGGVYNNQSEEFVRNYTQLTPLNRMAKAEDYHGALIFLLSPASAYMTGANLVVDGGWTAW